MAEFSATAVTMQVLNGTVLVFRVPSGTTAGAIVEIARDAHFPWLDLRRTWLLGALQQPLVHTVPVETLGARIPPPHRPHAPRPPIKAPGQGGGRGRAQ